MNDRERLFRPVVSPQVLLGSLVLMFGVTGIQTARYKTAVIPMPVLWAGVAWIAALGCALTIMFVPRPSFQAFGEQYPAAAKVLRVLEWRGWYVGAGASAILACLTRAGAILWAALFDPGGVDGQIQLARWIAATTWLTSGMFILATWFAIIIPWHVRARKWGS